MVKYRVNYVGYDTMSWHSIKGTDVVFASNEEEAKNIVENKSQMGGYEYVVVHIEKEQN